MEFSFIIAVAFAVRLVKHLAFILSGLVALVSIGLYVPLPFREPDNYFITSVSPLLKDVAKVELTELYFERMDLAKGKETDLKTVVLSKEQQNHLITILSSPWAPVLNPRGEGFFCHNPHHRFRFHSQSGSTQDLYVCFECCNASIGSREGYSVERDIALSRYMCSQLHSFVQTTIGAIRSSEEYFRLEFPDR